MANTISQKALTLGLAAAWAAARVKAGVIDIGEAVQIHGGGLGSDGPGCQPFDHDPPRQRKQREAMLALAAVSVTNLVGSDMFWRNPDGAANWCNS